MAYTVGLKRRFLPGYRKFKVVAHEYQNMRFILNLEDGGQEHIPAFTSGSLRVYADFWTHLQMERSRVQAAQPAPAPEPPMQAPMTTSVGGFSVTRPLEDEEPELLHKSIADQEAERRATERVRDILANGGAH